MVPMEELWDIARTAEYLGVTERTVYSKVRSGDLPAVKVGRLWRVRPSDVESWLSESAIPYRAGVGSEQQEAALAAEKDAIPPRNELESLLAPLADPLERRLMFVGLLTRGVQALGWSPPVVVGGHAVEFYTAGGYTTVDIDLAGASEPVAQVLAAWNFAREGRHWFDVRLGLVVEVPASPLAPSELEHVVTLRIGGDRVMIIGVEDLIIDRLAACKHWGHRDSCEWAARLLAVADEVDEGYLERRCAEEDVEDVLADARERAGLA